MILVGSHGSLPDRTFCQLTVSHNRIYPVFLFVHLSCQSHSHAYGKAVSEGSGIHLDSRQFIVWMSDVRGTEL